MVMTGARFKPTASLFERPTTARLWLRVKCVVAVELWWLSVNGRKAVTEATYVFMSTHSKQCVWPERKRTHGGYLCNRMESHHGFNLQLLHRLWQVFCLNHHWFPADGTHTMTDLQQILYWALKDLRLANCMHCNWSWLVLVLQRGPLLGTGAECLHSKEGKA
jgi:hypothetical protein